MRKILSIFAILTIILIAGGPFFVFAEENQDDYWQRHPELQQQQQTSSQDCQGGSGILKNPLKSCSFADLVQNIAEIVTEIGAFIATIALIYAGFLFVTARGDVKKLDEAKKIFFWTIIGTAILLGAWVLAEAIQGFVGNL